MPDDRAGRQHLPELVRPRASSTWTATCYHRSVERTVPGGFVQAFAGQPAGGDLERPVYTVVTGGLDVEHTADGVRQLAAALVAFVEEVESD